jgi:hypothetical protein
MELPCEICTAKLLLQIVNLLTHWIGPGIWLGLFFEYGSMVRTNMLGLERVWYRALRTALRLMGSTPNNCLGVLSGIPPLVERFTYFNFRYLVALFLGQPLRERFRVLGALEMSRFIKGYSDVLSLDIVPPKSFTRHELPALLGTPLVDGHMKKNLTGDQEAMYSLMAPASY